MKTAELTGAWLDYWTARAEGIPAEQLSIRRVPRTDDYHCVRERQTKDGIIGPDVIYLGCSTDWRLAGPLIEKYKLDLDFDQKHGWSAATVDVVHWMHADTPLCAVCRTVVEKAFGDEVPDVGVRDENEN